MIFEKETLKEIYPLLNSETLLVLDLDNTLIESVSHYGSYQWGNFLTRNALQEGLSLEMALDKIMPLWEKAQYDIEIKPIEEELHIFMNQASLIGVKKMALTGRSPKIADITFEFLEKHRINFSSWGLPHLSFELPNEYLFEKGVFFAGTRNEKGAVLFQFMNQINDKFKRVVFVDDQMHLVKQVQKALEKLPFEYYGVRYSGADKRVAAFDYSLAELERKKLELN